MEVVVRIYLDLRVKLGWSSRAVVLDRDTATVREIISSIRDLAEILFVKAPGNFTILVNGHNVEFLKGLDTVVKSGDVIDIFPPAAGGAPY